MSTDYDILCTRCNKRIETIASGSIAYGDKLWRGATELDLLSAFLFEHAGHPLLFNDSQALPDEDDAQPASQPSAEVTAAPISSYSVEDREFFSFWYGHMKADVMQSPLGDISHSTARYIWDAARAASGAEPVARIDGNETVRELSWALSQKQQAFDYPPGTLLYASPVARQPLTEEEIIKCLSAAECFGKVTMSFESGPYDIARPSVAAVRFVEAIERAHGIPAPQAGKE